MFEALMILDSNPESRSASATSTCTLLEMCDSHRWPSSHAQYMFFLAVYFTLLTWRTRFVAVSVSWLLTVLTMKSRVYLAYHTMYQVIGGAVLGIFLGAVWFWIVQRFLSGYFPTIEESVFGRNLYFKDTSHIPNDLKFEYDNARAARKTMQSKSS